MARRLGAGAFGVVYEAWDRDERAPVALKVLRFVEPDALYRFKKAVRLLADVRHPNLVAVHGLEAVDGWWFLSMELVDGVEFVAAHRGEAWESRGRSSSRLDARRLRGLLVELALGLQALHRNGRLHRDVKPSNVMVTREARVKLLDFGLVTELEKVDLLSSGESRMVGTPAYMAPEQAEGLAVGPASDWYSVGVMLYQTLTGELPFTGSLGEMLRRKYLQRPRDPREGTRGVPADLAKLALDLLRPEASRRPTGEEVLERLGWTEPRAAERAGAGPGEPVFVGRVPALAAFREALTASRDHAVSVYVRGSSGVGKTALVHRFLEAVRGEPGATAETVILEGRCHLAESVPYKALDNLIDGLSRFLLQLPEPAVESLLPGRVAELGRLFPVLRTVEAVARAARPGIDLSDPQTVRRRAFRALRELLAVLARRTTLVLFIDDLQWGDVDSFRLLEEILRPPEPPPFLLIGCYRSEDTTTSPFLVALGEHLRSPAGGDVRQIALGGLLPAESRELVELLQPPSPSGSGLGPRDVEAITRETGGSPYFLSELVRGRRLHGRLPSRSSPRFDLHDVLLARIDRLSAPDRRLLEIVALAGRPLDLALASRAAGIGSGFGAAVDRLHRERLLRRVAAGRPSEVETYHDRIREAVVASLDPATAEDRHRRLAAALETAGDGDPEALVVHFRATRQHERAREYALRAAALAEESLAFERAAGLLRLAVELTSEESPELFTLKMKLGHALAHAGRGWEAADSLLAAVESSGFLDPHEAQRDAAEQLLSSGDVDRGLAILRHVLRSVGMELKVPRRRSLLELRWRRLQLALLLRFHGGRLRSAGFAAATEADGEPALLRRIDVCWSVEIGLFLADVLHASEYHARHLILALGAGEPGRVARGLAMEVFFGDLDGGDPAGALELARGLAARLGDPSIARLAEAAGGLAAAVRGRWSEASRRLGRVEEQLSEAAAGVVWELDAVRWFRVLARLHLGRWAELFDELPRRLERARARRDRSSEVHLRLWVECLGHLAEDRPSTAAETASEAIAGWSGQGFHFHRFAHLVAAASVLLYQGRGARALELVEACWPELRRSGILRLEIVRVLSNDLKARAALAAAAAEQSPRRRAKLLGRARREIRRLERRGSAWAAALAALAGAGLASLAGAPPRTALERAEDLFLRADMPLHAAVARRRSAQLRGDPEGVDEADRPLRDQGVLVPWKIAGVLAPGAWKLESGQKDE